MIKNKFFKLNKFKLGAEKLNLVHVSIQLKET